MLSKMSIKGFRGFSTVQEIEFAIPNSNKVGSGLTTIVGSNNSGKTSIGECLRYLNPNMKDVFIPKDMRNVVNDGVVEIKYEFSDGKGFSIKTKNGGSSIDVLSENFIIKDNQVPFIVPSRRSVSQEFGGSYYENLNSRVNQMTNTYLNNYSRSNLLSSYNERILKWFYENNRENFDSLLEKILGYKIEWTMDTNINGQHYLSFCNGQHSTDGLGDGIWSTFVLADALYDSSQGSIIVVDEPELSIHPSAQKRIMETLMEFSKDRQIVISTHSPYFVNWESVKSGGKLCRVVKTDSGSEIFQLDNSLALGNKSFMSRHNPHVFGIDSREVFFLNDNIILVEGQEDVVCFKEIIEKLGRECKKYNFYGWGVSGSGNMEFIASILESLGYEKIVMILDGDKDALEIQKALAVKFQNYRTYNLPVDDIRDKVKYEKNGDKYYTKQITEGICDGTYRVKGDFNSTYKDEMNAMFSDIDEYFGIQN